MYEVGEFIIYGSTGTCKIIGIKSMKRPKSKAETKYYVLQPMHDNGTIFIPVGSNKVFMRPIITRTDAFKLIDSIPSITTDVFHSSRMRELTNHYEEALEKHDCKELIKLTKSAYEKKLRALNHNGKFGAIDQKYMNKAENLLYGELSCALGIPQEEIPAYIEKRIREN